MLKKGLMPHHAKGGDLSMQKEEQVYHIMPTLTLKKNRIALNEEECLCVGIGSVKRLYGCLF